MNVQQAIKGKGFTIIEVVLVLAIAGLIFLMVFIALPALQSSQRDTARKNDASVVASAVTSYTSNNRGTFPTTLQLTGSATGTPGGYVANVSTNTSTIKINATTGAQQLTATNSNIVITKGTACGAAPANAAIANLTASTSASSFTVVTLLETGSTGTAFCQQS